MRRLVAALALLASVGLSRSLHAQRFVIVDDVVRTKLAKDWDKYAADPYQVERAYCVRYDTVEFAGEQAYRVFAADPARTLAAGHDTIVFDCPSVSLHVHPAATCNSETECVTGGKYAYQCFPSDTDQGLVKEAPFALIQCDRKAVVFFWPHGVTPPPKPQP